MPYRGSFDAFNPKQTSPDTKQKYTRKYDIEYATKCHDTAVGAESKKSPDAKQFHNRSSSRCRRCDRTPTKKSKYDVEYAIKFQDTALGGEAKQCNIVKLKHGRLIVDEKDKTDNIEPSEVIRERDNKKHIPNTTYDGSERDYTRSFDQTIHLAPDHILEFKEAKLATGGIPETTLGDDKEAKSRGDDVLCDDDEEDEDPEKGATTRYSNERGDEHTRSSYSRATIRADSLKDGAGGLEHDSYSNDSTDHRSIIVKVMKFGALVFAVVIAGVYLKKSFSNSNSAELAPESRPRMFFKGKYVYVDV